MGGVSAGLEGDPKRFDSGSGVSLYVAGWPEKAGDGCISHDPPQKKSVFAGADRHRKDTLDGISVGKSSRGRAGGADLLCDGKDDHPDRSRRGVFGSARTRASLKDTDPDGEGKGLPV